MITNQEERDIDIPYFLNFRTRPGKKSNTPTGVAAVLCNNPKEGSRGK